MKELFLGSEKFEPVKQALRQGESILVEELWNAPKALLSAIAQQATGKHVLILTGGSQEEQRLFNDFSYFTDRPVIDFPAWETMPDENIPPSPDVVGERYRALRQVVDSKEPHIILSSLQSCLQPLIPPREFLNLNLTLKSGQVYSFQGLIDKLVEMGYERRPVAADKGEFAVRGGIIDIFPVSSPDPYRLEFWGDELESLRIYDPIGQKSVRAVQELDLTPGQEMELLKKYSKASNILDYLGKDTLIVFDDLLALEDRYTTLLSSSKGYISIDEFMKMTEKFQRMYWPQTPIDELSEVKVKGISKNYYSDSEPLSEIEFQMFNRNFEAFHWRHPFQTIVDYLFPELDHVPTAYEILQQLSMHPKSTLHFLCGTEMEQETLQKQILDYAFSMPSKTTYEMGYLSSGLFIKGVDLALVPTPELTRRYKIRRQKQRSTYHTTAVEVLELNPGDYVTHFNNGIGKFIGLEKKVNHEGMQSEYFTIEYAEHARLYVPMNQAHLVNKYIGAGEQSPQLHTLGSARWKKTRDQTQQAILGYANELLQMYAQRELRGGFSYPGDGPDMAAFEEDFPFVETEDQLDAVKQIKEDMTAARAMERLICGDVGYGKTEVAMRAAFKAVVDGHKQVAVLVPTTVLAMQHFENFVDRMRNFPVNVGVLSRFRSPKEIRETLKGVANGSVDILIGTHRIIGGDVTFKDLGLIIIDEEQRFGVKAKEHLKKIKVGVDCLTLSATPIPRTLYMSLVGARNMSVISTPPQDRLPIKTVLAEPHDVIIKNALMRELARDGQAYVIHNRVETIYAFADKLKKLLPQARVVVGHGQMSSDEIDTVFHAFKNGHADILVATTIVENGIDIPNANTILIDRADRFGLAELYQLRGRVGRWNRRAYAYFLVPSLRSLPELSRKRLEALGEASGYGGGMRIAMRDLELRGAGDILGVEQSGHVSSVGFHLYCKMLKRTIQTLQGKIPKYITDSKIDIPADARLPEDYVNEMTLRMEIYQRFGEAMSVGEVDEIWREVQDRFGSPPLPAKWLYYLTKLRVFASLNGFTLIKQEKQSLSLERVFKNETQTRRLLSPMPKKPEEIETKIIALIQKEFLK